MKRAAELQGRSVSDFVAAAAEEAAVRTIEEVQIIRLSVEDQRAIAAAILNPPPPMPAMERAVARNHKVILISRGSRRALGFRRRCCPVNIGSVNPSR